MTIYEEMSTVFKNKTGNTKGGQYALHHVSLAIKVTIMMLSYADHIQLLLWKNYLNKGAFYLQNDL